MASDLTLPIFYKIMFDLTFEHKYSQSEIESMIPFERDLLASMIVERLEERDRAIRNQEQLS